MVRAMVLVAPAVLNPLDGKFVMGRDPNANLFSPILNLRTRVEMTAKLAAFNLQVSFSKQFSCFVLCYMTDVFCTCFVSC